MKASEDQISGNHYKSYAIQPAEFIQKNKLNWCEGNAIKYLVRHRDKKGAEDLLKAKHYIDLLLEWEYPIEPVPECAVSLCHSCHVKSCGRTVIEACEESGECAWYTPALRERMMDAKEEGAKGVHISEWYAQESAKQSKPAPVALKICPSCDQHPGCKGTVDPAEDGSCKGFSAKVVQSWTRYDIWQKIETENARSKEIHGSWHDCTPEEQIDAIRDEYRECREAYRLRDVDGTHGEVAELIQLANLCFRRIQFLKGEADA